MRAALMVVVAVGVVMTSGPRAEQSPPTPQPAFRTGVELVQVDVSVLDKERQPVQGLTASDFTVREDGKVRPVTAFSVVDLPARAAEPAAAWVHDVAPDVVSNAVARAGRLVVILFDRTVRNADVPAAKRTAEAIVNQLGPADLAAVVYTARGVPQNFTADRRLLLAAIAQPFMGLADGDTGNPGQCLCGACTLETITRVADALREIPQRRKLLFFLGRTLPLQSEGSCGPILRDARTKLFRAADVANLTMHAFDSNGLETLAPMADVAASGGPPGAGASLQRQGDLAAYTERTGGRTIVNTNAPETLLPSIFAESRSYYVLGFEPANPRRDGRFHDIKVSVSREGVSVHPRQGYYAPAEAPRRQAPARQGGPSPSLVAAQAGLWPQTAVAMSVTAAAFANPAKPGAAVSVVMRAHEAPRPNAPGDAPPGGGGGAERVSVLAGAYDSAGKSLDFHVQTIEVTPGAGARGALDYEITSRLALEPGRHEIRVAAENLTRGSTGSVYTYVDVPDFAKAGVSLSGVVLGAAGGARRGAGALGDLLPIVPMAAREFRPSDRVAAFVRVYQGGGGVPAPVAIEAQIRDARDRTVFQQRMPLLEGTATGPRSADYQVDLPLDQLTAGDYLLTIGTGGPKPVTASGVRFTVK